MNTRIEAVLGFDGRRRLAAALQCTPQRFTYEPTRSSVSAVLELLELAKERGIPEAHLPARWQHTDQPSPMSPVVLSESFAKLFGTKALVPRLAIVLDMSQATIVSAFRGGGTRAHADLSALVELLEVLHDPSVGAIAWPERWWEINAAKEMQRSTRRPPGLPIDPFEMKARIERVVGGANASARLARALEKSPDALTRIWRSEVDSQGRAAKVQPTLAVVIELLETLQREGVPIEHWPERWRVPDRSPGRPRAQMTPSALRCAISAEG